MIAALYWTTPCQGYALRIAAQSWRQIDLECRRVGSLETGGILIGHYTKDESTAIVTEALPPTRDSSRGRTWFHRGVAGLRGLLANRWESELRTYYVGEWHYHPASMVEPSGEDLAQMYAVNADPRYQCREPIMIIVGKGLNCGEPPVRAFVFPHGAAFMEFEASDSLGTEPPDSRFTDRPTRRST